MDILIDPYRYVPVLPGCGEVLVMVKQNQTTGGASVGDGMAQSGPAVTARSTFLAGLQSFLTADLNHVTASSSIEYDVNNPLSLWGGFGQLRGKGNVANFDSNMRVGNGVIFDIGNGRFNTSANATGNWYVSPLGWDITLSEARTAIGFYFTDMGDIREAEVEFRLYNGSTLVRIVSAPIIFADKPRSNQCMWVGYANGNTPFTRVECVAWQHSASPSVRDFIGYDDFAVGTVITCAATATPTVHYGANTTGDTSKTVTGSALSARNAFAAAAGAVQVCDFESMAVGSVGVNAAISFSGGATGTISCKQYSSDHATISDSTTDIIGTGASDRWNTTAGGSKWYEFTDELNITLSTPVRSIGLYITDLGDQNATLRITMRNSAAAATANRTQGVGVSYYLPKADTLPGAATLLRFWGVTNEEAFDLITIQTMYYTTLTAGEYENPVFHVRATPDFVGIDDILIAA